MPEPIFELRPLVERALQVLRERGGFTPAGDVAMQLEVPFWAAERALEAAYLSHRVTFTAGAGWRALDEGEARPVPGGDDGQKGLEL